MAELKYVEIAPTLAELADMYAQQGTRCIVQTPDAAYRMHDAVYGRTVAWPPACMSDNIVRHECIMGVMATPRPEPSHA